MNHKAIALLAITLLISCNETPEPMPAGVYLTQVIYHQNADQIRYYGYNKQGKLAVREYEFLDHIVEKFVHSYSGNQLLQVDYHSIKNNQDRTLYLLNTHRFNYNSGLLSSSILYPDNLAFTYFYDASNRLVEWEAEQQRKKFQYNSAGNIETVQTFTGIQPTSTLHYSYDNFRNPFFQVDPMNDQGLLFDPVYYFSPNNPLKCIALDEKLDTTYMNEYFYHYTQEGFPDESFELYTSKINNYQRDTAGHLLYRYEILGN